MISLYILPVFVLFIILYAVKKKIDLYVMDIQSRLNDEYLELDYFQKQIMTKTLSDMKSLTSYMKQLKVENDG